jgi:hypothetical protein
MNADERKEFLKAFNKGGTPVATICLRASTAAFHVTKDFHNDTFVCMAQNITSSK